MFPCVTGGHSHTNFQLPDFPLAKKVIKTTLCTTGPIQLPPIYSIFLRVSEFLHRDIECP